MKHAVLIMAHKNKEQVIRLIKALDCEAFDFFVHCDRNWKLTKKELKEIEQSGKNVCVIKKRIHGELDRWSLPQITLNLMDEALNKEKQTGVQYNYFPLLSGQDYPIKSTEYIVDFLEKKYPQPLIDVERCEEGNWVWAKFLLVKWINKVEVIHRKMKPSIWRKIRVAPYVIAEKLEKVFKGAPYERLQKYNINLCGGGAWWVLPRDIIVFIKDQRKKNKRLIKELKNTWTPEETFFQIMTMNSPYADVVNVNDEIFDDGQKCMTYANFITPTKGFRGHPHDITVEDFERIMAKKALFARKFNIDTDVKVLDMIDEMIRG